MPPKLTSRSVLRYPGGKTRAVNIITAYFPKDVRRIISPFLGGGSIELHMAAQGISVLAADIFDPLIDFWQCLLARPQELAVEIRQYYPLSKMQFYQLQKEQLHIMDTLQRAAVFYVLNRSSFSGATLSGGMSPDHPRFTLSSIKRIEDFYNPNIKVCKADFAGFLDSHKNDFAYLDPPYLIASSLYGNKGDTHKNFAHETLAAMLRQRNNWLLSYNDCGEIRELYDGFEIVSPQWKYGMSGDKSSREILIFSRGYSPQL